MADEATDVQDAPVEDAPASDPIMDILTEDEQASPEAKSSTAEQKTPEVAKDEAEADEGDDTPAAEDESPKPDEEAAEEQPTADDAAEQPTGEDKPQGKAEQRKTQLNAEIRDLVAQKNALKSDIEKINAEYYQPATEDQLVAEGMSPTDARVEALSQRLEVKDYNDRVADAQLTIESESQQVLREFPVFNPDSPEYNKDLAAQGAELFNDSLIRDENTGQVIGSNLSVHKLYKALATSYNSSAQAGRLKGQQDTEKMLARADNAGGAAPKMEKKDPILAILEDVDGN